MVLVWDAKLEHLENPNPHPSYNINLMPKTAERKLSKSSIFGHGSSGNSSMVFLRQEIIATKVGREKVGSSAGKVGQKKSKLGCTFNGFDNVHWLSVEEDLT